MGEWQIVLTALSPGALLVALVGVWWERRKRRDDAPITVAQADVAIEADRLGMADSLAARAMALATAVQDQLDRVRKDLTEEQARSDRLEAAARDLEAQAAADRAYIAKAAPWIATHAQYAEFPPPIPPDWYTNT